MRDSLRTVRVQETVVLVNSASEKNQYEIQTAPAGIEGQANISDDIIVQGKDQEEQDSHLEKVNQRLEERRLTLNAEKCQFSMDKLTLYGSCYPGMELAA